MVRLYSAVFLLALRTGAHAQGFAQGFAIDAPTAGYVYNASTASLHPISGLPGASTLSSPVLSGISAASYSPAAGIAIAVKPEGVFAVSGIRSGASLQWRMLSASTETSLVGWGRNSAISYSAAGFALLTQAADALDIAPLSVGLPPGRVAAIDYDETAKRLYIALADSEQNSGVYSYSIESGALRRLIPLANPVSIAHSGSQVFALDGAASAIWAAADGAPAAPLPIEFDRASRIAAIAVSSVSARVYAADAGLSRVSVYDLAGTLVAQIPSGAAPAKLERLGTGSLLLLSNESGQPPWLLDDTLTPAVFFVPALKPANLDAQAEVK